MGRKMTRNENILVKAGKGAFGEGAVWWWAADDISIVSPKVAVRVSPPHLGVIEAALVEAREKGHPVRVDPPVTVTTSDLPFTAKVVLVHHAREKGFFFILETPGGELRGVWASLKMVEPAQREEVQKEGETPRERHRPLFLPSGEGADFEFVRSQYPWELRLLRDRALKGEIAQGSDRSVVGVHVSGYRGEGPEGEGYLLVRIPTDHLLAQGVTRFDPAGWALAKEVSRHAGRPEFIEPPPEAPRFLHFALLPGWDSSRVGIPAILLWRVGALALLGLEDRGEAKEILFSVIDLLEQDLGLVALEARARGEKLWEALQRGLWTQGLRRSRVRGTLFAWREGETIHLVSPWERLVFWAQVESSRIAEFLEGHPHEGHPHVGVPCPACGEASVVRNEDLETLEVGNPLECGACGTFLRVASLQPLRVEVVSDLKGPFADCPRCGYLIEVPETDEWRRDEENTCPECGYHFALDWSKVDADRSGL